MFSDNNVSVLAMEKELELIEDWFRIMTRSREFAKYITLIIAPEETTQWESWMTVALCTNSNVIITLKT